MLLVLRDRVSTVSLNAGHPPFNKISEDYDMISLAATASGGVGLMAIYMIALIAIFYFLLIRPQRKEQQRVAAMLSDMAVGDSVVTTSGFYGVILDITDDVVIVEFGNNKNCRIPMKKDAIAEVEKADASYETSEK